jgi:hypothetical protein
MDPVEEAPNVVPLNLSDEVESEHALLCYVPITGTRWRPVFPGIEENAS